MVIRIKLIDGKQAEFEAAAARQVEAVRANEPGTILYTLLRSQTDPTEYVFLESYQDEAAFEFHRSESAKWWRPTYESMIARPNQIERLDGVAGVGRDASWPREG
jgi:quinol monooxygenase YgiN